MVVNTTLPSSHDPRSGRTIHRHACSFAQVLDPAAPAPGTRKRARGGHEEAGPPAKRAAAINQEEVRPSLLLPALVKSYRNGQRAQRIFCDA